MQLIKNLLSKNRLLKNAGMIASGSAIGYSLAFLASPILTRLYSPTEFGVFTVYLSLVNIVAIIIAAKYDSAISLPEEERTAARLVIISLIAAGIITLVVTIGLVLFGERFVNYTHAYTLNKYLWIIPITCLLLGLYQVLINLALRGKQFKAIAYNGFYQRASQVLTQIAGGLCSLGTLGLILSNVIAQTVSVIGMFFAIKSKTKIKFQKEPLRDLALVAKRYKNFPLYTGSASFLNIISSQIPSFFLAFLYGPHIVGLYGMATRLLGIPVTLIAQSMSQVYFVETIELARKDASSLATVFKNTLWKQALMVLPIFGGLMFISPKVCQLLLGPKWGDAALYLHILAIVSFFQILALPFGQVLLAIEKQQLHFFRESIQIIILVAIFVITILLKYNIWSFLLIYCTAEIIYFLFYIFISWLAIQTYIKNNVT